MAASNRTQHNNRMHLTGYSGLRPLPPAGDAGRYLQIEPPHEGKMKAISLKAEAAKIENLFEYKTIAKMNGHIFTLIKAKDRTLDFHIHKDSDEVFYIVEGKMRLEFKDKIVHLSEGEMCVVPKGVEHRPVCDSAVTAMLIEIDGTLTPGNTGGAYKR